MGGWRVLQCGLVLVLSIACTGCWDSTEIDRLAIVTATGADLADDNSQSSRHQMTLTLQIARPSALGSSGGGASSRSTGDTKSFVLEQAQGQNLMAAVQVINKRVSRRLFIGQRRVVMIGEDYAKHGVYDIMDEVLRNPQSRLRTYVLVAYHDQAQSILQLPFALNRLPTDAIVDIEEQGDVVAVDARRFIQGLTSKRDPFAMGIESVHTLHRVSGKPPESFALNHIAIFKNDKLVGWLGGEQMSGFLWIEGRLRNGYTTAEVPGVPGYVSGRLLSMHTSRRLKLVRGAPEIHINVRAEYDIAQNGTPLELYSAMNMQKVRAAFTQAIVQQMRSTLDVLQRKYHADPFGFADQINKRHPRVWRQLEGHWNQVYSTLPVVLSANVDIRNSGLIGPGLRSPDLRAEGGAPQWHSQS